MSHRRSRPDQNRDTETSFHADAVVQAPAHRLARRIRDEKPCCDGGELLVAQVQVLDYDRGQYRNGQAVDEVDQRRQEDQANDVPAESGYGHHSTRPCVCVHDLGASQDSLMIKLHTSTRLRAMSAEPEPRVECWQNR